MWIDINSHIGQWPFKKLKFESCQELTDQMDQFGVDLSVIKSLNSVFYKNTQSANRSLYEEWKSSESFKDRLIPFATINPTYAGWKYDFYQCTDNWGMKGICVYPKYHDYAIDEPELINLVNLARDKGVIVGLALRMVDFRQRSWLGIEEEWPLKVVMKLIREVPDAKYFIWNVANSTKLDEDDLKLLKNSAVLLDTSGRSLNNLSVLLEDFGVEKFAFGSHAPILDYCTGRLRIEFLNDSIGDAVKDKLRYKNASGLLNII